MTESGLYSEAAENDEVGYKLPAVVFVKLAGHVDLWTSEKQEDDVTDDKRNRRGNHQLDGSDWAQFQPRHDETTREAAKRPR